MEWTSRYGQKARRGGMNYDPLGTAHRPPDGDRPPDAHRPTPAHRSPDAHRPPEAEHADVEPADAEHVNAEPAAAEHALAASIDQIGAAFELNFALIDPHPPGTDPSPPPSTPRRDFLFLPT